ncbi:hypothetical protein CS022_04300 [Veronia nyctiphanis]|uniref:YiaAB two helix domain-containing protein n=1 Tax=Veronia nyctiphanis TaxID=1278244 RepID=A0A4Q0YST1_9GAMM|nr:inner membrane protein YiaA [Veronia nyctiphanis]RXJ74282.1 hypothetical protein CS022_04300 [Veronia nyctiphanis]
MEKSVNKPTSAFMAASWASLILGVSAYALGLWNSEMMLNEKGYYLITLLFGLFSAISLQKTVRDKMEGIEVTSLYFNMCWFAVVASLSFLSIGLWNAELLLSEKGFYGMSYVLSLFASIAVQKNVRDIAGDSENLEKTDSVKKRFFDRKSLNADDTDVNSSNRD